MKTLPIVSYIFYPRRRKITKWPPETFERIARRFVMCKVFDIIGFIFWLPVYLPALALIYGGKALEWLGEHGGQFLLKITGGDAFSDFVDAYENETGRQNIEAGQTYGWAERKGAVTSLKKEPV